MINHKFDAETTPLYFYFALKRSYEIYAVYFLLLIICITGFGYPLHALPAVGWLIVCLLARYYINHTFIRWNLLFYVTISADGFAILSTIMDGKPVRQALFYH